MNLVIAELSARDRTRMANLEAEELPALDASLGTYLRKNLEWWSENPGLWESIQMQSRNDSLTKQETSDFLIKKIWEALGSTHRLRRIK